MNTPVDEPQYLWQRILPEVTLALFFHGVLLCAQRCPAQIQENFFGLHQNKYMHGEPWPTVSFGVRRTVSDIVTWDDLETCPGGPNPNNSCYHWGKNREGGNLDKVVNDAHEHGVEVMFTIYDTAAWISNRGPSCRAAGVPNVNCVGPADADCGSNSIGLCDPPADVDAVPGSGEADGSDKTFKDFVTAVATRYGKKIKYWEMWNEAPNIRSANPRYWTFKQWARMTKDFHDAVKRVNPEAIVLGANTCDCSPRGSADFEPWTDGYFSALDKYGPSVVDGISFHGYALHPPKIIGQVHTLRKIMDNHSSTRGKPFYDTEDAWPGGNVLTRNDGTSDWDAKTAWLGQAMILTAALGVKDFIFFGWDLPPVGQMWWYDRSIGCTVPNRNGKSGYLCPTALAYEQIRNWLLGAVFTQECSSTSQITGKRWTCDFSKNNGSYRGRIVWFDGMTSTTNYTPEPQYVTRRYLDGTVLAVKPDSSIAIGNKPVLLETK